MKFQHSAGQSARWWCVVGGRLAGKAAVTWRWNFLPCFDVLCFENDLWRCLNDLPKLPERNRRSLQFLLQLRRPLGCGSTRATSVWRTYPEALDAFHYEQKN